MEEVEIEVPEEVAPVMTEEVVQAVVEALAPMVEEVAALTEEVVALKKRFEKMAAEPAATKVKSNFSKPSNKIANGRLEAILKLNKLN